MSDDNDNLRREFADALAAAKRETKEDMRNEIAAYGKIQEKDMESVLATMRELKADNKEALAKLETKIEQRDKFMMGFIVVALGAAVAVIGVIVSLVN